jgi:hypothetical protein
MVTALLVVAMAIMILMLPACGFRLICALAAVFATKLLSRSSFAFTAFVRALFLSHFLRPPKNFKANIPRQIKRC